MDKHQDEIVALLAQHPSKEHISNFAQRIMLDPALISLTIKIGRANSGRLSNHASWALRKVFDNDKLLLLAFREAIFAWLLETDSDSVRRNLLPLASDLLCLEFIEQSELSVMLYDCCYDWSRNEKCAIAVRCNAMQYLYEMAKFLPELSLELIPVFELNGLHGGSGLKSRSALLLRKLYVMKEGV